jgi:hypothetical protein
VFSYQVISDSPKDDQTGYSHAGNGKKFLHVFDLNGLLNQGDQAKQFLNLCARFRRFGTIFTFSKRFSYGCSILVALLCSDQPFYPCYRLTLDFPEQNGEQK